MEIQTFQLLCKKFDNRTPLFPEGQIGRAKMNSKQIDCFIMVAEYKNFSQAAKLLYLNQSVVSYQINMLEKELNFQLFIRDTHNVTLSKAGENFFRDIKKLRELYNQVVTESQDIDKSEKNSLKISWQVFEVASLLGALLSTCRERLPNLQIELTSQSKSDYFEDLINSRKDIVFTYEENLIPDQRVQFDPLWSVTNYFIMNIANPLAAKTRLDVNDMDGQVIFVPIFSPETRTAREAYKSILDCFPDADIRMLSDFEITAMPHVVANNGVALYPVPRDSSELGIVSRPFGDCMPMVIGIAYRSDDHSHKTTTAISISKNFFKI